MIGVELPGSGSGTFQSMLSLPLQVVGSPVSLLMPVAVGPRHAGQLPAEAGMLITTTVTRVVN
jgi:hypothetical protein